MKTETSDSDSSNWSTKICEEPLPSDNESGCSPNEDKQSVPTKLSDWHAKSLSPRFVGLLSRQTVPSAVELSPYSSTCTKGLSTTEFAAVESQPPPPSREFKLAGHNSVPSKTVIAVEGSGKWPPLRDASRVSRGRADDGENRSTLPVYNYLAYRDPTPTVVYTQCEDEADALVQSLKSPLGFDLEWRVMWQAGASERRAALVQLCDTRIILLIQVASMNRFPKKVLQVIESPGILKTGANIMKDGQKLYRDFGIRARGLVELGGLARNADATFGLVYNREVVSLAKMVAMYLEKTLVKDSVRTSNWEAKLTAEMIKYAANDCHCALMVYNKLVEIATKDGNNLDISCCARDIDPHKINEPRNCTATFGKDHGAQFPLSRTSSLPDYWMPEPPSLQYLRAYKMWHERKIPLERMCFEMKTGNRVEPLKATTVISYVVGALQADPSLPFELEALRNLVQMDAGSWQRHYRWLCKVERRSVDMP